MEQQLTKSTADSKKFGSTSLWGEKSQKLAQQLTKSTADPQNLDLLQFRNIKSNHREKLYFFQQCALSAKITNN